MSNEQVVWKPVEKFQTKWRGTTLTFSLWDKGTSPVIITEETVTHIVLLPDDIRLCQATTVPAAASVPEEVADTLRKLLEKKIDSHFGWQPAVDAATSPYKKALAWLSTVTQEGKGDGTL